MPQKKRSLLIDAHVFDKEPQGTVTYIKGLYTSFINLYSDLYDIYITANKIDLLRNTFPGIPQQNFLALKKCCAAERLLYVLPKLITDNKIDYTHFQQIAPLKKACRYITTVHDVLFNDFKDQFSFTYRISRNFLFRKSLQSSKIRLTVSEYSRQAIEKSYQIKNVHITHNAVAEKYFKDYKKDVSIKYIEEKFGIKNYLLYVSRIEQRKNHLLLLKTYRNLKLYKQGILLVFVGKNDIPVEALNEEINSLGTEERKNFFWFENISDNDLLEIYRAALMFIYPSIAEGFGIPPIESTALQLNTLCSNTTAMKDFAFLGDNLFNPYNYNEFECKLIKNLQTPPLPSVLAWRREIVQKTYNWDTGAQLLHELIKSDSMQNT